MQQPEVKKAKTAPLDPRQQRIDSWSSALTSKPAGSGAKGSKTGAALGKLKIPPSKPKISLADQQAEGKATENCPVCGKDITHMDREAHVNRCLDEEGKKPEFSAEAM